jgi:hypothetical protein
LRGKETTEDLGYWIQNAEECGFGGVDDIRVDCSGVGVDEGEFGVAGSEFLFGIVSYWFSTEPSAKLTSNITSL